MSILFLLSAEEARKIPQDILALEDGWWWLRSPGNYSKGATVVYDDGSVSNSGRGINNGMVAVRPAIHIEAGQLNFLYRTKKGYVKLGTKPNGKPIKWIDISEYVGRPCLLMKKPIEQHRFDEKSNDYNTSEIKMRLDELDDILFTDEEREMIEDWEE